MKEMIDMKKFDKFCKEHEVLVGFIGCVISLVVLKVVGAF